MREEELLADKKSITMLDDLKGKKKHMYRELNASTDRVMQIDGVEEEMMACVDKVEYDLMDIEMLLQDALHTALGEFKDKTHSINAQLKDKTHDFIKFVVE